MATMYYSSESSDSDNQQDRKSLDLSYLLLDSDTLASHLRNSVREQHTPKSTKSSYQSNNTSTASASTSNTYTAGIDAAAAAGSCGSLPKKTPLKNINMEPKNELENKMEILSIESVGHCFEGAGKSTLNTMNRSNEQLRYPSSLSNTESSSATDESETDGVLTKDAITEKLFLNHNLIINVPFELVFFHKLRFLDISNNNISHMNDFVLQLPELQTLYLKNNQIDNNGLPKDLFVLRKLRELNLSGNLLTEVPPQIYESNSLRYLYLGNNAITELRPEIKALTNLQVLHMGGNSLTSVPDDVGELSNLNALVLSNNRLCRLPRAIRKLSKLRSLLLHNNNLCSLPVEIVKLSGISELSLRDNPLVTRFVNSCAKNLMFNPPSLKELAARTVRVQRVPYTVYDLPTSLHGYLSSGHKCVNPDCKGVYFSSCVEHIKFVDFCGMYRVPLMHYLCSSRCTSQTPSYYRHSNQSDDSDDEAADSTMRKVLLG